MDYTFLRFAGGLLVVSGWSSPTIDLIPPARIRDLTLVSAVEGSDELVLDMTTPGDDVDVGGKHKLCNISYLRCLRYKRKSLNEQVTF